MLFGKFTAVIFSCTSGAAVTLLWLLINITHTPNLPLHFPAQVQGQSCCMENGG